MSLLASGLFIEVGAFATPQTLPATGSCFCGAEADGQWGMCAAHAEQAFTEYYDASRGLVQEEL